MPKLKPLYDLSGRHSTWSADGTKIATIDSSNRYDPRPRNIITVWDAETGKKLHELSRAGGFFLTAHSLAFVNDDKDVLVPAPPTVPTAALSILDVESGEVVRDVDGLHPEQLAWNINSPASFALSPDGSMVAVAPGRALAQPVVLYSTTSWQPVTTLPAPESMAEYTEHLAFSADGRSLAFNHGGEIWVYDVSSRRVVQKINPFPESITIVTALAMSADGSMVGAGTDWMGAVPNPKAGPPGDPATHNEPLFVDVPVPEAVRAYRTSDAKEVAGINVFKKPSLREPQEVIYALTWSPDGSFIAFADSLGRLHLWNPLKPEQAPSTINLNRPAFGLAFSPNGGRLAVDDGDSTVTIFDVTR